MTAVHELLHMSGLGHSNKSNAPNNIMSHEERRYRIEDQQLLDLRGQAETDVYWRNAKGRMKDLHGRELDWPAASQYLGPPAAEKFPTPNPTPSAAPDAGTPAAGATGLSPSGSVITPNQTNADDAGVR